MSLWGLPMLITLSPYDFVLQLEVLHPPTKRCNHDHQEVPDSFLLNRLTDAQPQKVGAILSEAKVFWGRGASLYRGLWGRNGPKINFTLKYVKLLTETPYF